MKKKLFIVALALCLLLTACAVQSVPGQTTLVATEKQDLFNSPEPMPGFDADNRYIMEFDMRIQQAGDIIFGGMGRFMRYYDMASGVSGMVCPNPECSHDSKSCGAYVEDSSSTCYYNGKRYWVSFDPQKGYGDYYLWRSDLSGENREKVKRIGFNEVILAYQPQWYAIHRGRLYFLGHGETLVDGNSATRMTLMYSPLDGSEEFTAVFDEAYEHGVDMEVRFVGNAVYCFKRIFNHNESGLSDLSVTRYDRETGAAETLYEETGIAEFVSKFWVTEDGTPYLGGKSYTDQKLYVWRVENGQKVEIISRQGQDAWVELAGGIADCEYWKDGKLWVEIITLSGESLYSGLMYPNPIPGMEEDPNSNNLGRIFMGGDRDKIIVQLTPSDQPKRNYTILLDIRGGMKATVLWSNEQR